MAIVVQKYGGSSVADIEKLHAVADHVADARRAGNDVVVVVSAMGKTTENLLELAREAARQVGDGSCEPPRRELDMLVSTGERVSMALLSIAIQARGLDAISFTGSQSGIMTNDRHFDARIIEVRPHRIEDELARGRIVIVAGYQGMSYRREITTLGRGGSDTTAVALAAALGAERCEIYSDVDGVYSADPRGVPDARHLPALDYATMQEMAESGAKVLNAQAVEWAKEHRVRIVARRTGDRAPARETVVGPEAVDDATRRAVVVERKLALLAAPATSARALVGAATLLALPLRDLSIRGDEAVAVVPLLNVPDFARVRRELTARLPDLALEEGLGAVSLIGVEVGARAGTVLELLDALPAAPRWITGTPLRVTAVMPVDALGDVERAWHARFVAAPSARLSA
ncbi:MAG: aspartate kinase [Sorangiineae bacterium]|nr:aspartate kinase [Polyangiaceae bacterium]MEB2325129.1 aspartate kinase [Sorangiineae bacterium]